MKEKSHEHGVLNSSISTAQISQEGDRALVRSMAAREIGMCDRPQETRERVTWQ